MTAPTAAAPVSDPGGSPVDAPPASTGAGARVRWLPVVLAVGRRPGLWPVAVAQLLRLAPTGWWRRAPFLPLPDRAYLRFRMQTAYGDPGAVPRGGDVVTYLHWCRAWPRVTERP